MWQLLENSNKNSFKTMIKEKQPTIKISCEMIFVANGNL